VRLEADDVEPAHQQAPFERFAHYMTAKGFIRKTGGIRKLVQPQGKNAGARAGRHREPTKGGSASLLPTPSAKKAVREDDVMRGAAD
jgi:hypothetical protein